MDLTNTKKVDIGSFIKARIRIRIRSQTFGSGSDHKGPDPTRSGSATLLTATGISELMTWHPDTVGAFASDYL
jgi:hypothetical protein